MRSLVALVLVATTAACAARGSNRRPDPQPVIGTYRLVAINHRALPTNSPTEPNVIVQAGQLTLDRSQAFTLQLFARNAPQLPPTERTMRGSYTTSGDTLVLSSNAAGGGGSSTMRYFSAGGRFTLRDARGNQFDFALR